MRTFKLYSLVNAITFDLQSNGILATNPKGLGNSFNLTYVENEKKKYINNFNPTFENAVFDIYFNISSNGYTNYSNLASFLNSNVGSEMLLEYCDGNKSRYSKVLFKSLTKTEINEEGALVGTLTLDRISYWYRTETIIIGKLNDGTFKQYATVKNEFYDTIPVDITFTVSGLSSASMWIKDYDGISSDSILKWTTTGTGEQSLIVTASDGKKVNLISNNTTINGYKLIDKKTQSFIYLKYGTWRIGSDLTSSQSWKIEITITHYLLD